MNLPHFANQFMDLPSLLSSGSSFLAPNPIQSSFPPFLPFSISMPPCLLLPNVMPWVHPLCEFLSLASLYCLHRPDTWNSNPQFLFIFLFWTMVMCNTQELFLRVGFFPGIPLLTPQVMLPWKGILLPFFLLAHELWVTWDVAPISQTISRSWLLSISSIVC